MGISYGTGVTALGKKTKEPPTVLTLHPGTPKLLRLAMRLGRSVSAGRADAGSLCQSMVILSPWRSNVATKFGTGAND